MAGRLGLRYDEPGRGANIALTIAWWAPSVGGDMMPVHICIMFGIMVHMWLRGCICASGAFGRRSHAICSSVGLDLQVAGARAPR